MNPNLKTDLPEVFKSPLIRRHGVVYAETRRTDETTLAGNMHDNDLVISQKNYQRLAPPMPYDVWTNSVRQDIIDFKRKVKYELGLKAIGQPTPVHGDELISLDEHMDATQLNILLPDRPQADATVVSKLGFASCFSPADCVISNIVDINTGVLSQIHTGYAGLEKQIAKKTFGSLEGRINPKDSVVYLAPHAQDGYIINQQNNILVDRFASNPLMQPYLEYHEDGAVAFNLTSATVSQLEAAGVKRENIQISQDNALTDPTLFSQSNFLTRGLNGRNGIIFGRSNKIQ